MQFSMFYVRMDSECCFLYMFECEGRQAGTCMGMMWLGQLSTGRPLSMSSCLMCFTFLWWALRSACPSGLFRTRTDSRAPARDIGGRAVVKMKPAAKERTVSTRAALLAMYPPTQPKALPGRATDRHWMDVLCYGSITVYSEVELLSF